ncbi:hypothetical protein BN6_37350 [Saccharothrix espanaensis DSM 44229]|uniref:Uncharacterized protein n=1 Tax=Saccharothrix espanaensis (strain ATCC 51144 / DSM 44229 / JCM 9112 / NBRC 15066 / NRRL 15764) TaxID=1179773 RepID=K0JY10_SACES|nr:hypothetical protein BN6_37350 [Saccharothrix espanaensis DSM 44229]
MAARGVGDDVEQGALRRGGAGAEQRGCEGGVGGNGHRRAPGEGWRTFVLRKVGELLRFRCYTGQAASAIACREIAEVPLYLGFRAVPCDRHAKWEDSQGVTRLTSEQVPCSIEQDD